MGNLAAPGAPRPGAPAACCCAEPRHPRAPCLPVCSGPARPSLGLSPAAQGPTQHFPVLADLFSPCHSTRPKCHHRWPHCPALISHPVLPAAPRSLCGGRGRRPREPQVVRRAGCGGCSKQNGRCPGGSLGPQVGAEEGTASSALSGPGARPFCRGCRCLWVTGLLFSTLDLPLQRCTWLRLSALTSLMLGSKIGSRSQRTLRPNFCLKFRREHVCVFFHAETCGVAGVSLPLAVVPVGQLLAPRRPPSPGWHPQPGCRGRVTSPPCRDPAGG